MKTDTDTKHSQAYNQGYDAGVMLEYPSNPYHEGSQAYDDWKRGYQAGQDNAPPCEDE